MSSGKFIVWSLVVCLEGGLMFGFCGDKIKRATKTEASVRNHGTTRFCLD